MTDREARVARRDEIVISAECGSFTTHEPHAIAQGFLGFGRRMCKGYTHRHFWKLAPFNLGGRYKGVFLFNVDWKCHCGESYSINKHEFYSELAGENWSTAANGRYTGKSRG